jgi:hypothetical protein
MGTPVIISISQCDPNGIRTHFEDFVMLRNFARFLICGTINDLAMM